MWGNIGIGFYDSMLMNRISQSILLFAFLTVALVDCAHSIDPYTAAKGAVHIIHRQAEVGAAAERRRDRDAQSAESQRGRRGEMLVGSDPQRESNIDFAKYGLPPGGGTSVASAYTATLPPAFSQGTPKVEMFVASKCRHCDELLAFLREEGITVRVYDLERDRYAEEDYLKNIGRGVLPVTRIGSSVIRGLEAKKVMAEIRRQGVQPQTPKLVSPSTKDSFTMGSSSSGTSRRRLATNRGIDRRLGRILSRYDHAAESLSRTQRDPSIKTVYQEVSRLELEESLLKSVVSGSSWFSKNEVSFGTKDFEDTVSAYVNTAKRLAGITQVGEVQPGSTHLLRMRRRSVERRVETLREQAGVGQSTP